MLQYQSSDFITADASMREKRSQNQLEEFAELITVILGELLKYFELDYANASITKGKMQQRNQKYYRNCDSCVQILALQEEKD